ncbi:hypothetical protein DB30_06934 [Enhygromyxa salina]|uniref:Uncharacterized protein n=1 Tax=Enhygromyxa salina TaxID=215803 RepID=A0A0C2D2H8_9BACT|nr:hypothetical protein DB30_06934 [Enhygromyxa salina]
MDPSCADCSASPTLAVTVEKSGSDLIVKHGGEQFEQLDLVWSNGATGAFTLAASYAAGVDPRLEEVAFEYSGSGTQVLPTGGGMVWSRAASVFNLEFRPLDAESTEESEGVWMFDPAKEPPIRLKVVIKRKTDSFSCPA